MHRTFVVNTKHLGLLQTIAGSETLLPFEDAVSNLGAHEEKASIDDALVAEEAPTTASAVQSTPDFGKTCFYISPIGEDGTEVRKHSDMFLSSLVEPALEGTGLRLVRADKIASGGMITAQVIEHVLRSRLAIVDLSWHNPNAFYEMALRHAAKRPVVQITRKQDRLPFDVNQVRTVVIDTSDIYTLVPRLPTYRAEIATQVRASLAEGQTVSNPLTVFCPDFSVSLPKS